MENGNTLSPNYTGATKKNQPKKKKKEVWLNRHKIGHFYDGLHFVQFVFKTSKMSLGWGKLQAQTYSLWP